MNMTTRVNEKDISLMLKKYTIDEMTMIVVLYVYGDDRTITATRRIVGDVVEVIELVRPINAAVAVAVAKSERRQRCRKFICCRIVTVILPDIIMYRTQSNRMNHRRGRGMIVIMVRYLNHNVDRNYNSYSIARSSGE